MRTGQTDSTDIKCLTVKRPWSGLITSGVKRVENRSWSTKHRGRLYIHAGKGVAESEWDDFVDDMPAGAIVGHVTVVDCVEDSADEFAEPGYFHWILADAVAFATPVPCTGKLGLWNVADDVSSQFPCSTDS